MSGLVLLVEEDEDRRSAQVQTLQIAGFRVEDFRHGADALAGVTRDFPDIALSDVRMPGMDGLQLLQHLHTLDRDLPVILLSGHGDVPMAGAALKASACDRLTKPVECDVLLAALNRAVGAGAPVLGERTMRQASDDEAAKFPKLGGSSELVEHRRAAIYLVAQVEGNPLLTRAPTTRAN